MVVAAKPRKSTKQEKLELSAKSWLADVGFTEDQIAEMADKFTPTQMAKIAEGYMRQSDYDRSMNEGKADLEQARTELTTANERLNMEMAEWATLQRQGKDASAATQRSLEAAEARVAQLTARVTRLATESGVDPKTVLEGITSDPPSTPKPAAAPDLTGYVKVDDLDAEINRRLHGIASGILDVPAALYSLGQEHQQLFGEPLDTTPLIAEIKQRAKNPRNEQPLDPRAVWEELHQVADKRREVDQAQRDAEIAAAVERGRTEARSEAQIPGSVTAPGRHAAIFGERGRESALKRPQPLSTVTSAASALRSHKYRQERGSGSSPGDGAGAA